VLNKELLIQYLEDLISIVERNDSNKDILQQIRKEDFFNLFRNAEFEYRLRQIDHKIDILLARPISLCRMVTEEGGNAIQLMTNTGDTARKEAIEYLHEGLSGAKQLVICDPYFLISNSKTSNIDYLSGINEVIPKTVKNIELYVKPRKRDADVAAKFTKLCKDRKIKLICRKTNELHDRVWIVDSKYAFVIGASFNGLGNKCAFILELPEEDRRNFIKELDCIRKRTVCSKSA